MKEQSGSKETASATEVTDRPEENPDSTVDITKSKIKNGRKHEEEEAADGFFLTPDEGATGDYLQVCDFEDSHPRSGSEEAVEGEQQFGFGDADD
jgi:hypothetical protein